MIYVSIECVLNGRKVQRDGMGDLSTKSLITSTANSFKERIEDVRDPVTGAAPTIVVTIGDIQEGEFFLGVRRSPAIQDEIGSRLAAKEHSDGHSHYLPLGT